MFPFSLFLVISLGEMVLVRMDDELPVKNYSNHQVWRVFFDNKDNNTVKGLRDLFYYQGREDVLRTSVDNVDVLLTRDERAELKALLNNGNFSYGILYENVQEAIEEEARWNERARLRRKDQSRRQTSNYTGYTTHWDYFPSLEEIEEYLQEKVRQNGTICSLISIGKTLEKRDIWAFKISTGIWDSYNILIESGAHAREWMGVVSSLYLIEQILEKWLTNEDYRRHNWYIVPVLNPDGYHYTFTNDRLWRKNRRRLSYNTYGVDINRNFEGRLWCEYGASRELTHENYCGAEPMSEAETRALRTLHDKVNFFSFLSIHGPASGVTYPWFWSTSASKDYHSHRTVASAMVHEINDFQGKVDYLHGWPAWLGAAPLSGTSLDWMYANGVYQSYLIDFPGEQYFVPYNASLEDPYIVKAAKIIYLAVNTMVKFV